MLSMSLLGRSRSTSLSAAPVSATIRSRISTIRSRRSYYYSLLVLAAASLRLNPCQSATIARTTTGEAIRATTLTATAPLPNTTPLTEPITKARPFLFGTPGNRNPYHRLRSVVLQLPVVEAIVPLLFLGQGQRHRHFTTQIQATVTTNTSPSTSTFTSNRLHQRQQQVQPLPSFILQQRPQKRKMSTSRSSSSKNDDDSSKSLAAAVTSSRNDHVEFTWKEHRNVMLSRCILPLDEGSHKGSSGRIAIIGGSALYTGAPYYAASAALKTGADLVTIFTAQEAAIPLKSYSPEFMVNPVYSAQVLDAIGKKQDNGGSNQEWSVDNMPSILQHNPSARRVVDEMIRNVCEGIDRYHCLIVGPGLGRCPCVGYAVGKILQIVRRDCPNTPVVLDADSLWFLSQSPSLWQDSIVRDNSQIILTPNRMELKRLEASKNQDWADAATIILKGAKDSIGVGFTPVQPLVCVEPGGLKRSGGIGDILSGTVGTLAAWQYILQQQEEPQIVSQKSWIPAAWTACHLVRRTTRHAWLDKKRSMTAPDVLERLGGVFDEMIGQEYNERGE